MNQDKIFELLTSNDEDSITLGLHLLRDQDGPKKPIIRRVIDFYYDHKAHYPIEDKEGAWEIFCSMVNKYVSLYGIPVNGYNKEFTEKEYGLGWYIFNDRYLIYPE